MKLRTRIMALILAVVLCISMTATGVYAEEAAANILETTVELVEDHACEEHDETAAELETVPAENAAEADAEADIEDAKPQADTADATDAEVEVEAAAPSDESMESAPVEEVDVAEVQDEALVEDTTATSDEEAVDEVAEGVREVEIEEVAFQSYAETLNSDGTTLTERPEINYGKIEGCIPILVKVEEYYSMAFEALELINEERAKWDLDPVVMDEVLLEAAFQRAAETVLCWDHGRADGTYFQYICPIIRGTGENIGYGCITAEEMIAGWMSSIGHRANIIYETDVSIGVACVKVAGRYYWVMNCSESLYKEADKSNYVDGTNRRTVRTTEAGGLERTTIRVNDSILNLGETAMVDAEFTAAITHFIIPLPAEGFVLSSTDESVCTVSADGTITGVGEGSASIIAYYPGYEEGAWEIPITVCVHEYTSEVTTAPACVASGTRTYTCAKCGDVYTETIATLGHSYDDGVVTTEAKCFTNGVMTYTCSNCGKTKTSVIYPPYDHSYDDGEYTVEPTCVADGEITYICTVCGDSYIEPISAQQYTYCAFDDGVVTKEPTCKKVGVMTYTCKICGYTKTRAIPKVDHVYDEGVVTTATTCSSDGVMTYSCTMCGTTVAETIPAGDAHTYEATVTTASTCISSGVMTYTCTGCGDNYTEQIAASGHDYEETVVAATCEEGGYTLYVCSECEDSYQTEKTDAIGHSYTCWSRKESTCDKDGAETYLCNNCFDAYEIIIPATGHTYDGGKTTKTATCTEAGVEAYTCTTCGNSYTVVLPMASHKEEKDVATPAGCESTGLTEGSRCSVCSTVLVAQEETPATGHSWDDGVVTKEATTLEIGIRTYTCSTCGDTKAETIPMLEKPDHDVNADGVTDVRDLVTLMKHIVEAETAQNLTAADVNGDGNVDLRDAVCLVNHLVK